MSDKKNSKAKKITAVIALVIIIPLIISALVIFIPHGKELKTLYVDSGKPADYKYLSEDDLEKDTHRYHYHACTHTGKIYIDSDTDLEEILGDNDPEHEESLGAQTLKLRISGIRYFTEDWMGVWVKYPVLVYEYQA